MGDADAPSAPDAINGLLLNPGAQCTLFPFLGAIGESKYPCYSCMICGTTRSSPPVDRVLKNRGSVH